MVSNLLYVDDLKVFARKPRQMEECKQIIKTFSDGICMDFGVDKCAVVHIKNGKIYDSPWVTDIPLLSGEDSYKYLGVLECDAILHDRVKTGVKAEYLKRMREVLRADLPAKNTVTPISAFAMPVLRYGFGVIR